MTMVLSLVGCSSNDSAEIYDVETDSSTDVVVESQVDSGTDINTNDTNTSDTNTSDVVVEIDAIVVDSNVNDVVVDSNAVDSSNDTIDSNVPDTNFVDSSTDTIVVDSSFDANTPDTNPIDSSTDVVIDIPADVVADVPVDMTIDTPVPFCGDGIVNQATEQCDDGNPTACDGCENCQRKGYLEIPSNGEVVVQDKKLFNNTQHVSFWYKLSERDKTAHCKNGIMSSWAPYPELHILYDTGDAYSNYKAIRWNIDVGTKGGDTAYTITLTYGNVNNAITLEYKIPDDKVTGWHQIKLVTYYQIYFNTNMEYHHFNIFFDGQKAFEYDRSKQPLITGTIYNDPNYRLRITGSSIKCNSGEKIPSTPAYIDELKIVGSHDQFDYTIPFIPTRTETMGLYEVGGLWHFDETQSPYIDSSNLHMNATTTKVTNQKDNCYDHLFSN